MVRHMISNVDQFLGILQGCNMWSDTIRIEIDSKHHLTMDLSDPESMGCVTVSSSSASSIAPCLAPLAPSSAPLVPSIGSSLAPLAPLAASSTTTSIFHIFLVDQLIEAFQTFTGQQNHEMGIYLSFTEERAKLVNVQHEYMTQDVPLCEFRPLHQFCHIELPPSYQMLELEFPIQEWTSIMNTFCVFAGNRGTPLRFSCTMMERSYNLVTMEMTSDAGHSVKTSFRCKPTMDIPMGELLTTSIQGQVLLHNLLNASKFVTTTITPIRIHEKGIFQDVTFPNSPYRARMFYVNVPTLDYNSFS